MACVETECMHRCDRVSFAIYDGEDGGDCVRRTSQGSSVSVSLSIFMQVSAIVGVLLGDGDEAAGLAGRIEGRHVVDAASFLARDASDSSSLASASTVDASRA